jgi:branched-chain amino acid transport system substrate-binding protein
MARASLREYQRELAERLRSAEAGRSASKLGLQAGGGNWLVDLGDAGEVIPVKPITPVPLTQPWFRGVTNIRGNLFSVVDFGAYLGGAPVAIGDQSRLVILGERFRTSAGRALAGLAQPDAAAGARGTGRAGRMVQGRVHRPGRKNLARARCGAAGTASGFPRGRIVTRKRQVGGEGMATKLLQWGTATVAALAAQGAAAQGVTADKILVGQGAVFSGPAAQLGIQMRNGIKSYFDFVNEKGGVHGRKLELVTEDDQYESKVAPVATKKLIEQHKVFALVGYVGTPTGVAALPVLTEAKVPLVGMFTGAEVLRVPHNRYVFHVRASYYDETEKIVEQVLSTGGKKIAVFYQNDAYGQAGLKGVEIAMGKRNLKIAALGTVERNTVKVEDAVKTINASQPDAVVMVSAYTSCAEFIRQMKKAGSGTIFYNVSFVGSKALSDALGKDGVGVAISQVVPFPWATSVPVVKEYQQLAGKAGFKDYNFSAMEGFLVAKVFVEGLRRTGKDLNREKFIDAMEKMNDVDLGGFFVGYSPKNHIGSKFVDLTIIARDGKFLR